jgi:cold shock CspA family protein
MSLENGCVYKGIVKSFGTNRGFGFIQAEGCVEDDDNVFVHQTDIVMDGYRCLYPNEEVEFTLEITGSNEYKARYVRLLSERNENDHRQRGDHQNRDNGHRDQGPRKPLVDAGQRALVRIERLEAQFKKLIETLSHDRDGVILEAADISDIYSAASK